MRRGSVARAERIILKLEYFGNTTQAVVKFGLSTMYPIHIFLTSKSA
jgi:hypothetical protein